MIERALKTRLLEFTKKYPIVTLTGPRQSGKSTLLKTSFPEYKYVSLEDPDMRLFATEDPRGFLATYSDKTLLMRYKEYHLCFLTYKLTQIRKQRGNVSACRISQFPFNGEHQSITCRKNSYSSVITLFSS